MNLESLKFECSDFTEVQTEKGIYPKFSISVFLIDEGTNLVAGCTYRNIEITTNSNTFIKEGVFKVQDIKRSTNCCILELATMSSSGILNDADNQYLNVAQKILDEGYHSENRTKTDTYKLFGDAQLKFDLRKGLPVLTTKNVLVGALKKELCWFNRGETNIKSLGTPIWDEWATDSGELGPVYGEQWRNWLAWHEVHESQVDKIKFLEEQGYTKGYQIDGFLLYHKRIDQLNQLIENIKNDPNNRRMIVTAWNPAVDPDTKLTPNRNAELGMQALPPCHTIWQVGCTKIKDQKAREDEFLRLRVIKSMHEDGLSYDAAYIQEHSMWLLEYTDIESECLNMTDEEVMKFALDKVNAPEYYLDLKLYQRSADWFLGVPFNIASYAMQAEILAAHTGTVARNFYHTFGDFHIYENHVSQLRTQIEQPHNPLPRCYIEKQKDIAHYLPEHINVLGYEGGIKLTGEVAV